MTDSAGPARPTHSDTVDALTLREQVAAPNGPYAVIDVVASTGSTNADLLAAAAAGAADRTALIAREQTAGRGRQSRQWASPAGTGLYLSVLVRPATVPAERLGTLSLVAGLALRHLATDVAGVAADSVTLKWPNDLLVGSGGSAAPEAKCAGVLAEVVSPADASGQAAVIGVGINVAPLPVAVPAGPGGLPAGSLAEAGATTLDLTTLAAGWLRAFAELETAWRQANGDVDGSGVLTGYRDNCGTLGQRVRAELPGGASHTGTAVTVDPSGRLVVRTDAGAETALSAADVVHLH